ncbi:MAG: hypothetical protein AAFO07_06720 [Bacteroidota bacterium]
MKTPFAILQKIDDDTLTLMVDGEVQKIKHQLDELKTLLQEKQVQTVQYADKIYNIEQIDHANFGFVTGKKAFNEKLTRSMIEVIHPISIPAQRFSQKVAQIPNWENQVRISDKAKEIIAYSFVGVIGIQLSKLMAIGKEDFSETKQRKYIQKCVQVTNYSLDLINYVLLSTLWDRQKEASKPLDEQIQKIIALRFENAFAPSIQERYQLLRCLFTLFDKYQLPLPIEELQDFDAHLQEGSALEQTLFQLQTLNEKLDRGQFNLLDCFEAETQLAGFFQYFAFLVNYNMASIKQIGYRELRNDNPLYLHRFNALGIDSKANVDAERIMGTIDTVQTDAVLFYKGKDYRNSINLYPFVIDYNTLMYEYGAKVCFFQSRRLEDDSLEFVFLEDNSIVNIEQKDIFQQEIDLGELMMDDEKRKVFNLNCVVNGFTQAKKEILAELDLNDL